MLFSIYSKALRERWMGLLIGAASVAGIAWMGVWVYADIGDASNELFELMPEAFLNVLGLATGLDSSALILSEMANFIAPMILCGIAITMGADAVAGEERWGTMGLLLANPRSRLRLVVEKFAAIATVVTVGAALMWGAYWFGLWSNGASGEGMHLGSASVHLAALALFFGALSLAVGAWTGDTFRANMTGVTVMLVSFLASGLLPLYEWGEAWARFFPWHYLDGAQPFLQGVHWGHVGLLVGAAVVMFALALVGVRGRDLKVGEERTTLLDRMARNPHFASTAEKIAGQAQVKSILTKTTSESRTIMSIAAGGMFYMAVLLGPMFKGVASELGSLVDAFPESMLAMVGWADYSQPTGWYHGEIFSILAPIAVALVGINMGAKALAGEERDRTMGVLLDNPIQRLRVIYEKAGSMLLMMAIVGVATFAGTMLGNWWGGLGLSAANVAAACVHLVVFGAFMGAIALFLGAWTGRSGIATGGATGLMVLFYATASFLPINSDVAFWAEFSPFHYYASHLPLENGFDWGHLGVLMALTAVLVTTSTWAFQRRDLRG